MTINLYDNARLLKSTLQARCTDDNLESGDYVVLRKTLLDSPISKNLVPKFVKQNRSTDEFWAFIRDEFKTYRERRAFLKEEFAPLLESLELYSNTPSDSVTTGLLSRIDSAHVSEAWHKALERRVEDPEGAITMARTLLEATCKHILDEVAEPYDEGIELPRLYKKAAGSLNLAPSQHTEEVQRQIVQGCATAVEGLGSMRNRLGDAHGRGKQGSKPLALHAELAVNLSGTICSFLLGTLEMRKTSST